MQSYYEVLFFKSGALHTEYWRVYFELHGEDLAILEDGKSLGLKTQKIIQSSGVLNLLPRDLDNGWNEFGRIVDDGNLPSRGSPLAGSPAPEQSVYQHADADRRLAAQ